MKDEAQLRKEKLDINNGLIAGVAGSMGLLFGAKLLGLSLGAVAPVALPLALGTALGFGWMLKGDGIPEKVEPQAPDSSKGFAVMIGRTNRGKPVWFSLGRTAPHMMVAGSTGYGKTAFVQYLLYTIAHQTQKFDLKIIDLKRRMSFGQWENLPFCSGVVGTPKDAIEMLREVRNEMNERLEAFDHARSHFRKDPYFEPLILLIDEGSLLAPHEEALEYLHEIAAIGREPRTHLIYCTQHPKYSIIPTEIRDQFGARFAFHLDEKTGSEAILGQGDYRAFETMNTPGRCVYKGKGDLVMQVPHIPSQVITAWIKDMADASAGRESSLSSQTEQGVLPGF